MKKYIFVAVLTLVTLAACKYEAPDVEERVYTPKEGWSEISIEDLKNRHTLGEEPSLVDDNVYIHGIVVGDDESGNIYKTIYLQDETGGIALAIDQTSLYNVMPVGQEVFVELNGLWIGDYQNGYQIGDTITDPQYGFEMAQYDWTNEYRKDENGNSLAHFYVHGRPDVSKLPEPIELTSASAITTDMYCCLVTLKNIKIQNAQSGNLAWATKELTTNRTAVFVEDESTLIVRTSGYSNFYADLIPTGVGDLVGILNLYQQTNQFFIRDRNDIKISEE